MKIRHLFIDMDNTIIDWSRGDIQESLNSMSDPESYKDLKPISDDISGLIKDLKVRGWRIHLISGIPDYKDSPQYISDKNYLSYYNRVCAYKDMTISKYFKNIFDTVDYTMQSQSKALYIRRKYEEYSVAYFIDDHKKYVEEWHKYCNSRAFLVNKERSCVDILRELKKID